MRATVELIERDGAAALSMRRVAAELGVAPMSLYNHLPNKAALIDAAAEHIMGEIGGHPDPGADWCDQARALARSFRAVARRYPRSVLVVIGRRPRTSVGLRPVEVALAAVRRAGFDDQTSVRLVRTFVSFVVGSMLHEAGADEPGERLDAGELAALAEALGEAHYTNVRAVLPMLAEHDHEADFEFGLELLIGAMQSLPRGGGR